MFVSAPASSSTRNAKSVGEAAQEGNGLGNGGFGGQRGSHQFLGLGSRAHELQTARQALSSEAARDRDRRMSGEVEKLRQAEHDIPQWLFRRPHLHLLGADLR